MTRPSSLPATATITSTFCGTITGVSLAACERSSADMVDQPGPADDCSSVEVEYFLDPWVERSIAILLRPKQISNRGGAKWSGRLPPLPEPLRRHCGALREAPNKHKELIDKALQERLGRIVADIALLVDQSGFERDIGLASQQERAKADHDRTQVLLRQRGTDGARRCAGDEDRLVRPYGLAVGARTPVDRIFQESRNRAIVLGRDDQHAIRGADLAFVVQHLGREARFEVLVEHRQVVDANEPPLELAAAELYERLGEPAVDRLAPVGTDDHRNFRQRYWSGHVAAPQREIPRQHDL